MRLMPRRSFSYHVCCTMDIGGAFSFLFRMFHLHSSLFFFGVFMFGTERHGIRDLVLLAVFFFVLFSFFFLALWIFNLFSI